MKAIQRFFAGMVGVLSLGFLLSFAPAAQSWTTPWPDKGGCYGGDSANASGGIIPATGGAYQQNAYWTVQPISSIDLRGGVLGLISDSNQVRAGKLIASTTLAPGQGRVYCYPGKDRTKYKNISLAVRTLPTYDGYGVAIHVSDDKNATSFRLCNSGVYEDDILHPSAPLCSSLPTVAYHYSWNPSRWDWRCGEVPETCESQELRVMYSIVKKTSRSTTGNITPGKVITPSRNDLEIEIFPGLSAAQARTTHRIIGVGFPRIRQGGCDINVNIYPKVLDFGVQSVKGAATGKAVGQEKTFNLSLGHELGNECWSNYRYSNRLYVNGRFTAVTGLLQNVYVSEEGAQQLLVPSNRPGIAVQIKGNIAEVGTWSSSIYDPSSGSPDGEVAMGPGGYGNIPLGKIFPLLSSTSAPTNPMPPIEMKAKLIWTTDKPTLGPWNAGLNLDVFYR